MQNEKIHLASALKQAAKKLKVLLLLLALLAILLFVLVDPVAGVGVVIAGLLVFAVYTLHIYESENNPTW